MQWRHNLIRPWPLRLYFPWKGECKGLPFLLLYYECNMLIYFFSLPMHSILDIFSAKTSRNKLQGLTLTSFFVLSLSLPNTHTSPLPPPPCGCIHFRLYVHRVLRCHRPRDLFVYDWQTQCKWTSDSSLPLVQNPDEYKTKLCACYLHFSTDCFHLVLNRSYFEIKFFLL